MTTVYLTEIDHKLFKDWLELNINNITWEGRYGEEFNNFWAGLFPSDITIVEQFQKIDKAILLSKSGPLISWFQWLRNKFLCYLYLHKDFTILELSQKTQIPAKEIAVIARDFFVERFPHLEEKFNSKFHISHITCKNMHLKFSDISNEFQIDKGLAGTMEDDILKSLEVTLYKDWNLLTQKISLNVEDLSENINKIKKGTSVKRQLKFVQDLVVLFLIGGLFIAAVKFGNEWYENKLIKEITLFEPNFFWLDKGVNYQSENPLKNKAIQLSYKELDELEKLESEKVFESETETKRYVAESDVVLTSVNSIPKDFTSADLEQSDYEEKKKGGYRNVRYGGRKAYRIMMTSDSPLETKEKLIEVLKKYNVKQVDNVKPGTSIPGGIYFNLHVPQKMIKEFLSHVSNVRESRILESKTVFRGPRGTNKVFIWIKQI